MVGWKTGQHTMISDRRFDSVIRRREQKAVAFINVIVYSANVKSSEFRRWLAEQGATFKPGKGSHLKVFLNGRQSVLPMHGKELKKGLVEGVKKQLGLK
jgi:mRNA interferase HicA